MNNKQLPITNKLQFKLAAEVLSSSRFGDIEHKLVMLYGHSPAKTIVSWDYDPFDPR